MSVDLENVRTLDDIRETVSEEMRKLHMIGWSVSEVDKWTAGVRFGIRMMEGMFREGSNG